jgi:hypothetical protein
LGGRFINASGALRGEVANVCLDVIASEAKQSISPRKGNPSRRVKKEWIASLRSQ